MKQQIIQSLSQFRNEIRFLKKEISELTIERVSRKETRNRADDIATKWVEELRSPLEHKFRIDRNVIQTTSADMKRLHILSRPNNLRTSYLDVLNRVLRNFDNKFILPIKQFAVEVHSLFDLAKIIPTLPDPKESEYLKEAVECANSGYWRAAIVMGWCCAIDRIQRKVMALGFAGFNRASLKLKNQQSGKFKRWNKEFSISTLSELQTVFDKDLIVVLEGMNLIDGNQAERLTTCFEYRNHSAHPGDAPIEEAHVVTFFTDINKIIFQNSNFQI